MGFVIAALLFLVLIGMIVKSVRGNKRKVNLYKTGNGDSTTTTTSTPFFFAGSDNSNDCGSSFWGDSGSSGGDGGSCGGD